MDHEFHKIRRLPPYVFAEVNAMKADARAAGEDIIDFGMGNPDQPPALNIIEKLKETVADPKVHRPVTTMVDNLTNSAVIKDTLSSAATSFIASGEAARTDATDIASKNITPPIRMVLCSHWSGLWWGCGSAAVNASDAPVACRGPHGPYRAEYQHDAPQPHKVD